MPNPGENVYACTECSCVFKKLGSLNGHMTRNHPETKTIESIKTLNKLIDITSNTEKNKDILQEAITKTNEIISHISSQTDLQAGTIAIADIDNIGKIKRYQIKQRTVGSTRWHLCNFCTKEFRKPSDLVRHLRVHTREKPYRCKICSRSFAVKSTLTTHLKTHSENEKKERSCKVCLKIFPTPNDYGDHMKKYHMTHTCKVCMKSFRNVRILKQHSRIHMTQEEVEKCISEEIILQEPIILTNKGIQTVDVSLKKRPLKEAGSMNRPYRCSICGGCYRKFSHLKQHKLMHLGERPFKCKICRNSFQSNNTLKNHMLTHSGHKPFNCGCCNKKFTG